MPALSRVLMALSWTISMGLGEGTTCASRGRCLLSSSFLLPHELQRAELRVEGADGFGGMLEAGSNLSTTTSVRMVTWARQLS